MSKIPVTSSRVKIDGLHPRFIARLEAFFADPYCKPCCCCLWRAFIRTTEVPVRRLQVWQARLQPCSNPDRKLRNGFQGSYHMSQPAFDGFGYAVDFRITGKGISTGEVKKIAAQYGMHAPVRSEWWHHTPGSVRGSKFEWLPLTKARSHHHLIQRTF